MLSDKTIKRSLKILFHMHFKCQDLFISALYLHLCDRLSLQVKDDWTVPWTPRCIWSIFKLMKSLMKLFIRERISVHLQFDISNISQPFHQHQSTICSELATEGRSGILTKLLLKAVGHSLAAELGGQPNPGRKACV